MGRQVVSADLQPDSVKAAALTVAAELTDEDGHHSRHDAKRHFRPV